MVTIPSLWAPIMLGAVLVFVSSSVIHMFLSYHKKDFRQLKEEDDVMEALREFHLEPGDYVMPYAGGMDVMNSDEFKAKVDRGPVAFFTVLKPGAMFNMGPQLAQWFAYSVLIGGVAAYVAGRTLAPGADYLEVFRLTGTVTFCCYALSLPQRSIWYKHSWAATGKSMFDGLVYAMLTAGTFGWLWPS